MIRIPVYPDKWAEDQYSQFHNQTFDAIVVCNFFVDGMEIEIYASTTEMEKSFGYRHMVMEDRLLGLVR